MSEHASIFYLRPDGPYLLCYDADLEEQAAPKRDWYTRKPGIYGRLNLPHLNAFEVVRRKQKLTMRVIYNPVKTEFSRRPDGYVDRVILIDDDWISRCAMQFRVAFPAGLHNVLIESFNPPELL